MFALFFCFMDINYSRIRCMKDLPKGERLSQDNRLESERFNTVWKSSDN